MEEKVLSKKRNGMAVLCGILLLYAASVVGIYFGAVNAYNAVIFASIFLIVVATILLPGLKVLKPQEALVLTLFGNYVGTLKEDGFLFCESVLLQRKSSSADKAQSEWRCK